MPRSVHVDNGLRRFRVRLKRPYENGSNCIPPDYFFFLFLFLLYESTLPKHFSCRCIYEFVPLFFRTSLTWFLLISAHCDPTVFVWSGTRLINVKIVRLIHTWLAENLRISVLSRVV